MAGKQIQTEVLSNGMIAVKLGNGETQRLVKPGEGLMRILDAAHAVKTNKELQAPTTPTKGGAETQKG